MVGIKFVELAQTFALFDGADFGGQPIQFTIRLKNFVRRLFGEPRNDEKKRIVIYLASVALRSCRSQ